MNKNVTINNGTNFFEDISISSIEDISLENPYRVILFNDEIHTFGEVINQIIKATRCSFTTAEKYVVEVHETGKACVYTGDINSALRVSSILNEIQLMTQIES